MKFEINTRAVGYKGQDKTIVEAQFHFVTVPNDFAPDLLGDTQEVMVFDSFTVDGIDILAKNFENEGQSKEKSLELTESHLQGLVVGCVKHGDKHIVREIA